MEVHVIRSIANLFKAKILDAMCVRLGEEDQERLLLELEQLDGKSPIHPVSKKNKAKGRSKQPKKAGCNRCRDKAPQQVIAVSPTEEGEEEDSGAPLHDLDEAAVVSPQRAVVEEAVEEEPLATLARVACEGYSAAMEEGAAGHGEKEETDGWVEHHRRKKPPPPLPQGENPEEASPLSLPRPIPPCMPDISAPRPPTTWAVAVDPMRQLIFPTGSLPGGFDSESGASTPTDATQSGLSTPLDSEPPSSTSGLSTPSVVPSGIGRRGRLEEEETAECPNSPAGSPESVVAGQRGEGEEALPCVSCGICSDCDVVLDVTIKVAYICMCVS